MTTALEKLQAARSNLVVRSYFYGFHAMRLRLVEDPDHKTIYADGRVIGFNPDFILSLPFEHVVGVLAHEVGHVSLLHPLRVRGKNPEVYGQAADYVVNAHLVRDRFSLPSGALMDSRFDGMSTEDVYRVLMKEQQEQQDQPKSGQGWGDVQPFPGESAQEEREFQERVTKDNAQAEATARVQAKMRGQSGDAQGLGVDPYRSRKNWRADLEEYIQSLAKVDSNWFPPNRRMLTQGVIMPSKRGRAMGRLVLALDTSGSVNRDMLNRFAGAMTDICYELKPETIEVVHCDYRVRHTEEFTCDDLPLELHPKGGGGTDFRPVFDFLTEDPDLLIYLTDLEGAFPDKEPDYAVCWVNWGLDGAASKVPFGKVIGFE